MLIIISIWSNWNIGVFLIVLSGRKKIRRRPTLPHRHRCSTIGAEGLNFCVRDGNRCDPLAIATVNLKNCSYSLKAS